MLNYPTNRIVELPKMCENIIKSPTFKSTCSKHDNTAVNLVE